jgi:hypothetical protein
VALAQGLQFFSSVFAPLVATTIGDTLGFWVALVISGIVQLVGFAMFAFNWPAVRFPMKNTASS